MDHDEGGNTYIRTTQLDTQRAIKSFEVFRIKSFATLRWGSVVTDWAGQLGHAHADLPSPNPARHYPPLREPMTSRQESHSRKIYIHSRYLAC